MLLRSVLVGLVTLIWMSGSAQAFDIVASGPVYGGPPAVGGYFSCRIFNHGTTTVNITQRRIYKASTGTLAPISTDNCGVPLLSGKSCVFYTTPVLPGVPNSCRIVTTQNDVKLSGVAELQNASGNTLLVVPLNK